CARENLNEHISINRSLLYYDLIGSGCGRYSTGRVRYHFYMYHIIVVECRSKYSTVDALWYVVDIPFVGRGRTTILRCSGKLESLSGTAWVAATGKGNSYRWWCGRLSNDYIISRHCGFIGTTCTDILHLHVNDISIIER